MGGLKYPAVPVRVVNIARARTELLLFYFAFLPAYRLRYSEVGKKVSQLFTAQSFE